MTGTPHTDPTESIQGTSDPRILAERHQQSGRRPERIGPYRILSELGEGGMGIVYLAEQEKPIHRRVALKVIKLGMDTKHVIARFETEREALALMNHPNVAGVFDAGMTNDGRPYFAMEHVPGVRITDYCDTHRLTTEERLHLFTDVCDAVQHAHQKGIIHRDIKPSNVLVTVRDDKPVVKVIDFGVAKATQHRLTEHTLFTEHGQLIGTPGYMSPEQAEMTALDIDTRTDIYSLGVLLYELLVGARPFDEKVLRQAGLAEIQRIIRENDPPKPSTKFSSLGEDSTVIAQKRHTEPRTLARELRGDLDWIVMKCLEKDRVRRYATANGLALEIERYLRHEPVLAGPPSAMYRLRKFVRRNRAAVLATSFMALVLCAGITVVTWQEIRARRAALVAARASAYRIGLEAQAAADRGDTANSAKVIADCTRVIELEPDLAPAYVVRAKMLSRERNKEAALRDCDRALELEPKNSLAWRTLGYLRLEHGDFQGALEAYEKGIQVLVFTGLPEDFHNRARLHRLAGNYALALEDHDRAIALAPKEGVVYQGRGLTRWFAGDIHGALDDFAKGTVSRNPDVRSQCNVWIWEIQMLAESPPARETADAALLRAREATGDARDIRIVDMVRGEVSPDQVLASAKSDLERAMACYYAGAKALVDGDRAQAVKWFQAYPAKLHDHLEFDLAKWHLEQLSKQ